MDETGIQVDSDPVEFAFLARLIVGPPEV
jgi:hypothetical protein